MTAEERLRELLQSEADELAPSGDGLQVIAERLAQRRSLGARLRPVLAIGGVVALVGAAAVTVSMTDAASLRPAHRQISTPHPEATACTGGLCPEPRPSPTVQAADVTTSSGGTPIWPFTTDAEAAAWTHQPGDRAWAGDPVRVTQRLLLDVLALPGTATRVNEGDDVAVVEVSNGSRPFAQVRLVRVGRADNGPWSVTGASSDDLTVEAPVDGAAVSSPLRVRGTASRPTAVQVRLLDAGLVASAVSGSGQPWSATLSWTRSTWTVAALAASAVDAEGNLSALAVTAVRPTSTGLPSGVGAGSAFVAVDDIGSSIVVVDAVTGQKVRQLSYPEDGATDSAPDRGGEDGVVWVRTEADACTSAILRAGLAHGPAGVTVDAKPVGRSLPSLSSGGRSLGWFEQQCAGDTGKAVVVRGPDARFTTVARTPHGINDLDVRDDGWAAVQQDEQVLLLPPGSTDLAQGVRLAHGDGCLVTAPAWQGLTVLAWEQCSGTWTVGRWSTTGALLSRGRAVPEMSRVLHFAVSGTDRLVALDSHRIARLVDDRLVDLPNALRWRQPDW